MKNYVITLRMLMGEIEKYVTKCVVGESEEEAYRNALEGECHDEPEFDSDSSCYDMGGQLYYRVYTCHCIECPKEWETLKKYL